MERFHRVVHTVRRHALLILSVAALGAMVASASSDKRK